MKKSNELLKLISTAFPKNHIEWVEDEKVKGEFRFALNIFEEMFAIDISFTPYLINFKENIVYCIGNIELLEEYINRRINKTVK